MAAFFSHTRIDASGINFSLAYHMKSYVITILRSGEYMSSITYDNSSLQFRDKNSSDSAACCPLYMFKKSYMQ